MTETTTPLQPTTVEPTKLQPNHASYSRTGADCARILPLVNRDALPRTIWLRPCRTLTRPVRPAAARRFGTRQPTMNLTVDAGEFIAIVGRSEQR